METRLYDIGIQNHTTENLLIDQINEFAHDCFGDLLIDTSQTPVMFVEDEENNIKDLLNWAANRQIIEV